jgi:hypothetical protein
MNSESLFLLQDQVSVQSPWDSCQIEPLGAHPRLAYRSRKTKLPELRFRALLTEGAREVRFERAAVD